MTQQTNRLKLTRARAEPPMTSRPRLRSRPATPHSVSANAIPGSAPADHHADDPLKAPNSWQARQALSSSSRRSSGCSTSTDDEAAEQLNPQPTPPALRDQADIHCRDHHQAATHPPAPGPLRTSARPRHCSPNGTSPSGSACTPTQSMRGVAPECSALSGDRCNPHPHVFSNRLRRPDVVASKHDQAGAT